MTDFSEDIRRFIHETFDSVVKLEVLLLLRGDADRAFGAAEVAAALQVSKDMMHAPLLELCGHGLLQPDQTDKTVFRYAPANQQLRSQVDAVAELYRVRRAAMVSLIYSQPIDRVRSFADAFKLRKET